MIDKNVFIFFYLFLLNFKIKLGNLNFFDLIKLKVISEIDESYTNKIAIFI